MARAMPRREQLVIGERQPTGHGHHRDTRRQGGRGHPSRYLPAERLLIQGSLSGDHEPGTEQIEKLGAAVEITMPAA